MGDGRGAPEDDGPGEGQSRTEVGCGREGRGRCLIACGIPQGDLFEGGGGWEGWNLEGKFLELVLRNEGKFW